jgi:hypothetical protein
MHLRWLLSFALFFFSVAAFGAESEKTKSETLEKKFIETNIKVSKQLDNWAEGLDLFLVGKRITKKRNETYVRIENTTFVKEHKDAYNETNINANIRLPNFEEYWQLKFSTYDEPTEQRRVNPGYGRRTPRERNVGATVGLFRKLGNVRTSFQPRVQLSNPIKISHSLAFESVAEVKWLRVNPKFELYADANRGVGLFQALHFNIEFTNVWSLLLFNQGDYEERLHRYSVTNGFSVGQMLSESQSLSYNLYFLSNNRPNYHLQNYSVGVSWSETIYRKILDYQITPYLDFDESIGYAGTPGVNVDINLNF